MPVNSIAVFCGSKAGVDPLYEQHAIALGKLMAEKNITLDLWRR
jgi:predicted Rossmann-fold nucleotide-binding protein